MASQVLSGRSNPSYTNNTGQNVRLIIYYMSSTGGNISMSWGSTSNLATSSDENILAIGKDLCFYMGIEKSAPDTVATKNLARSAAGSRSRGGVNIDSTGNLALPIEIMLAPTQTFSATCGNYNILVITEA